MSILTGILSAIGSVFTTYVPALAGGIYEMFVNVFCTTAEGAVTGLNELGYTALAFIGIGIVSGLVATVLGILRVKNKKGKKSSRKKK